MTVMKLNDGKQYAVGAEFSTMEVVDDKAQHTPFKVFSLYVDEPPIDSTWQCIKYSTNKLIGELPAGTDSVAFRSFLPQFTRSDRIKRAVSVRAAERWLTVMFYKKSVPARINEIALDASERKKDVVADLI
jgi:hypothetical protein